MGGEVLLLLGADQGDVRATFSHAEQAIAARCGPVLARSRDHWTEPWGFAGPALFLNRALLIDTALGPDELMDHLLAIERELGRVRGSGGYTSRPIDIDILLWGAQRIDLPRVQVPHPRLHERAFALAPAADLLPLAMPPGRDRTVLQLLDDLRS
ncbi:MAG TPA: 2-amino-4-hydroxy-6-hydroxymethyldihydropteridine diphosphokinase [Flavobacteriales bacterium]|nr:2-amino-4-hydroxy-6-hydroxymethyldihydropteridine diphosphokinase [Flavobacteriales bacterium]HMR27619.1 2-amino-4-hydroxy-6-hydroxymethyldihydropteridine diphosphokinase [Flavobacteriales bacterium]